MKLDFQETTNPSTPPGMRSWQALKRGHSFVILLEELMGEKFVGWTCYPLSWKKLPRGQRTAFRSRSTTRSRMLGAPAKSLPAKSSSSPPRAGFFLGDVVAAAQPKK